MIVDVIKHYLPITKSGAEYTTICPFHNEKTPSFRVVTDRQFYYCHGCGASGDVIQFVKDYEKVGFKEAVSKIGEILNLPEEELKKELKDKSSQESKVKNKPQPLDGEFTQKFISNLGYKSNNYRGIRDEINKFFGHLTKLDENGNVVAQYYPETYDGYLTGYKCRNHPKDFSYGKVGDTGIQSQLSGQVKFKSPSKYVLYVGGEADKTASYQMLLDQAGDGFSGIPVVSPTSGENGAAKQAKAQYEWFDMYDIIVIGMDSDAAGKKAALEIAEVLPKDKVRIATWSMKDPNEMLLAGKQKQFIRDFYNAKEYSPSGIESSGDSELGIAEFLTAPKIPLPPNLHRLQTNMRGGVRSTGAIVNIIGDTSIGKTTFSDNLMYFWLFNSPLTPTIVSLERTKEELLIDLLSLHLKKNLMWFTDGHDAVEYLNSPEVEPLKHNLMFKENGEPRFYVIDERKGDIDTLKKQIEKSTKMNDSKLIIIDPLTDYLRSLGNDIQDMFFMWQKLHKKNGVVFINCLHTRKPLPDKDGKLRKVTEYDALGSGTFVQSADINIVINRDKMNPDNVERNTTYVDLPKCRGGVTGSDVSLLYYDHETKQQYDRVDYFDSRSDQPVQVEMQYPELEDGGVFDNVV